MNKKIDWFSGLFFGLLIVSAGIGAAFVPLGIYVFHFPTPSGYHFSFNWWTMIVMIIGAVVGVFVFYILIAVGMGIWLIRYPLLVIAEIVAIIWIYVSHQPLWLDIVLGIGIACGWISIFLFRKYQAENERNYVATEKSTVTSDEYSKDAINSGVKERHGSERRIEQEKMDREYEKEQRKAEQERADRLNRLQTGEDDK